MKGITPFCLIVTTSTYHYRCSGLLLRLMTINDTHTHTHPHTHKTLILPGQGIGSSQTFLLEKTPITRNRHPCCLRDSNPQLEQPSSLWPTCLAVRPPGSANMKFVAAYWYWGLWQELCGIVTGEVRLSQIQRYGSSYFSCLKCIDKIVLQFEHEISTEITM